MRVQWILGWLVAGCGPSATDVCDRIHEAFEAGCPSSYTGADAGPTCTDDLKGCSKDDFDQFYDYADCLEETCDLGCASALDGLSDKCEESVWGTVID